MRLGISINFFDGHELLEPCLENIRPLCDHISVVYQLRSNRLNDARPDTEDFLSKLKNKKLIDVLWKHNPFFLKATTTDKISSHDCHWNEMVKRSKGFAISSENNCSHYLSADVDEFYDREQFAMAKKRIEADKYDATACPIFDYYSNPTFRKKEIPNYFVPFICETNKNFIYTLNGDYFCYVDPTRRLLGYKNSHLFNLNEMVMHHMTGCRIDKESYLSKFENSSARDNFKNINNIIDEILNFNPKGGDPEIEVVEDKFGIEKYF